MYLSQPQKPGLTGKGQPGVKLFIELLGIHLLLDASEIPFPNIQGNYNTPVGSHTPTNPPKEL